MESATWGTLLLAIAVAAAVIGTPGALIGFALRLRGLWLASAAPLLGATAIALASIWAAVTHLRWSWLPVFLTALVLAALAVGISSLLPGRTPQDATGWPWAAPIGAAVGAGLLAFRFFGAIGHPEWFDQAGDNVFHLNVVRWIIDHGDASPFDVMELDAKTSSNFYPDAWHATTSLVAGLGAVPITVASNAVLFVTTCVIWPLGAVLLARTLFGASTPLLLAAGAISAGFGSYPLYLIPYMGTYPLVFSIALVPAAVACACSALRLGHDLAPWRSGIVALFLASPGIALAHPSAAIMVAVLALPIIFGALFRLGRARADRRTLAVLLALLSTAAVLALLVMVRPNFEQPNSQRSSAAQAIGELLTGGLAMQPIPFVLSTLMIIGVVTALRLDGVLGWVGTGMWAAVAIVYLSATSKDEFFRLLISDPWYADATRVAAFTPIVILPLAARGAEWAWSWIRSRVDFSTHPARGRLAEITAITLLGLIMVQSAAARSATTFMQSMFAPTDNVLTSPVPVSASDRMLMARLPSIVGEGDLIAGDPWTGASFVYALTGRHPLITHMLQPVTGQRKAVLEGIATSEPDGAACRAARALGVRWVLELHGGKTLPNRPHYGGLKSLDTSPNMRLAERVGDSSLYRIVGCDLR